MADYKQEPLGIKQWAEADRPREKLLLKGKSSLTDAELIAILLGSGTRTISAVDLAKQILHKVNNNLHQLAQLSVSELKKFKGIGEAKAIAIVSAMELGRRRKLTDPEKRTFLRSSAQCHELMAPHLTDLDHEQFWLILLKRNNEVISTEQISTGGVSGTLADPKMIFNKALSALASSVILVHNHPSGSIKPSQEDINLTKKLRQAGELLDIKVIEHLIFANDSYFSFADEGML